MAELTRQYDWADSPLGTPETWPPSLRSTVALLLSSRFPMLLWWGEHRIQFYNDAFRPCLGEQERHPVALGQSGPDCWQADWAEFGPKIDRVRRTGEATWPEERPVSVFRDGIREEVLWSVSYSPVYDEAGKIPGVLVTCAEQKKGPEDASQLSQKRFNDLLNKAPVAIAIVRGEDFVLEQANEKILQYAARLSREVLNKPFFEVFPEAASQGLKELMQGVLTTGTRFSSHELPITLNRNGKLEPLFLDVVLEPDRGVDGAVTGIIAVCCNITPQVRARRALAEKSRDLELAVEIGELGNFKVDVLNRTATFSRTITDWFGLDSQEQPLGEIFSRIDEPERTTVVDTISRTLKGENGGKHDLIYRVKNPIDQKVRYLRSIGRTQLENGKPVAIFGIIQDITLPVIARKELEVSEARYRNLIMRLEEQVEERTAQLQASVHDLQRSNQNLQQFAYIASHDLQEPLRKIQSFGDILQEQYATSLGDGSHFLERMRSAANRMSLLIRDLLSYSRISTQRDTKASLSLNEVVDFVLYDLELVIAEQQARIDVEALPTIEGDESQLGQLFLNLISNALKFRRPGVTPHIRIHSDVVTVEQIPANVKPSEAARRYYRIDVQDNGIGFEEKYASRIFQVFQRLHGKSQFAGTGIGLAICEKVVLNHGGAITAHSEPGEGATFRIFLPVHTA